jgi:hypothetical protein
VVKHEKSRKQILQFVAIQRKDTKEWAIPGGMVDPDEPNFSSTLVREFGEEATNSEKVSPEKKADLEKKISEAFANATLVRIVCCTQILSLKAHMHLYFSCGMIAMCT